MAEQFIHIYEMLQQSPASAYIPAEQTEAFALHPDRNGLLLVVGDFTMIPQADVLAYMAEQIKQGKYTSIDVEEMM